MSEITMFFPEKPSPQATVRSPKDRRVLEDGKHVRKPVYLHTTRVMSVKLARDLHGR